MNRAYFNKLVRRDRTAVESGQESETNVPNHRINKSVGGTDAPTNLVLMGYEYNGFLESDAEIRRRAIKYGWKLESWQDPAEEPFYHFGLHHWVLPDSEWNLHPAAIPARLFGP